MVSAALDGSTTLAALVDAYPELARELERLGLDYCCGGGATLADASAGSGLESEAVIAELASAVRDRDATPASWTAMNAAELVDHLQQLHHRYLWEKLPRITALVDKLVQVHGARHSELDEISRCFGELRADLEPHMVKEERVLFPMIRQLEASDELPSFHCGTLHNPISVMLREHDEVGALLAKLRQLTNAFEPPADGCATYVACFAAMEQLEADTHLHVHKENNVLFPLVVRMEAERAATRGAQRSSG